MTNAEPQGTVPGAAGQMRPLDMEQYRAAVKFQMPQPVRIFGSQVQAPQVGDAPGRCSGASGEPEGARQGEVLCNAPVSGAALGNGGAHNNTADLREPEVWAVPLSMPGEGAMSFVYSVILIGAAQDASTLDQQPGQISHKHSEYPPRHAQYEQSDQQPGQTSDMHSDQPQRHTSYEQSGQQPGQISHKHSEYPPRQARPVTVIDPGWPDRKNIQESTFAPLEDFLRTRGCTLEDIQTVIGTHAHPDHMGAVGPLAERAGAKIAVGAVEMRVMEQARHHASDHPNHTNDHAPGTPDHHTTARAQHHTHTNDRTSDHAPSTSDHHNRWQVTPEKVGAPTGVLEPMLKEQAKAQDLWYLPNRTPDILLNKGDRLQEHGIATDFDFEVLHTPGHTPGHVSLVDRRRGILIAADMILPTIFPGIGIGLAELGGNPIEDYLCSLRQLETYDGLHIIPGHGYCFTGLAARIDQTREHVLVRAREVRAALENNPHATIWQIASQLTWSLGWDGVRQSRVLVNSLRQTMMYRDLVARGVDLSP